jgi:hypothetical protein
MGMALAIHPLSEANRAQQIDRSGLQNAGPNPVQHMLAALPLDHDAIDAVSIEDMGQKQSGRPAADDCHLRSHRRFTSPDFRCTQRRLKSISNADGDEGHAL